MGIIIAAVVSWVESQCQAWNISDGRSTAKRLKNETFAENVHMAGTFGSSRLCATSAVRARARADRRYLSDKRR